MNVYVPVGIAVMLFKTTQCSSKILERVTRLVLRIEFARKNQSTADALATQCVMRRAEGRVFVRTVERRLVAAACRSGQMLQIDAVE